jgi:7,8-dihydroneopterin aldolase/epimerase/oxygenase
MESTDQNHEIVRLEQVELALRVGVYPQEREAPQRVLIDIALFRRHDRYSGGGLGECLDYDRIYEFLVRDLPKRPHTALLEELAEVVLAACFEDSRVEASRVTLRKPDIYGGNGVPALEVFRQRRVAAGGS